MLQYYACYILHNNVAYYIVYYLLQYAVLNEYICDQWRSKEGEVGYTPIGAGGRGISTFNTLAVP